MNYDTCKNDPMTLYEYELPFHLCEVSYESDKYTKRLEFQKLFRSYIQY
jgi:hypothetical protein